MANERKTKVITGTVRLSYANIWEPKSIKGSAAKYSVSLLIPKSDKATLAKRLPLMLPLKMALESSEERSRVRLL